MVVTRLLKWLFSWNTPDEIQRFDFDKMPVDAFQHILEHLTIQEKRTMRLVSKSIHDIVGYQPMRGKLQVLWCDSYGRDIVLKFNEKRKSLNNYTPGDEKIMVLEYPFILERRNHFTREELDSLESVQQEAVKEMALILKNPKIDLSKLVFIFVRHCEAPEEMTKKLFKKVSALFKSFPHQLHIESLLLPTCDTRVINSMLRCVKPGTLKELVILPKENKKISKYTMNQISELTHFQLLKELQLELTSFPTREILGKWTGIRETGIKIEKATIEDIIAVRDLLLTPNSSTTRFTIITETMNLNYKDIWKVFGLSNIGEDYQVPGSDDKFAVHMTSYGLPTDRLWVGIGLPLTCLALMRNWVRPVENVAVEEVDDEEEELEDEDDGVEEIDDEEEELEDEDDGEEDIIDQ